MSSAKPLDTGQSYRVQMWVSRVLAVVAAIQGVVILALAGVLVMLFPLKEVEPMLLVGGSKDEQIWRVEPFEVGTRGWDVISEKLATEYVVKRETIDLQTDSERWQHVAWLSSTEVFREFRAYMDPQNSSGPYARARREGLSRSVTPRVTTMLNPRQWQVEFERRDFRNGEEIESRVLVATLTVDFLEQEVRLEDRFMNPTGFTVTAYGLAGKSE